MVSTVYVPVTHPQPCQQSSESIRNRIEIVAEDIPELERFYNIMTSPQRAARLRVYYDEQLTDLTRVAFDSLDQQGKVDYLLLKNYLERRRRQLDLEVARDQKTEPLLGPFASTITALCEDRQKARPLDAKKAAQDVHDVQNAIQTLKAQVQNSQITMDKFSAFRAANTVDELRARLAEWYDFYKGYDPLFSWWVAQPYAAADQQLGEYAALIREKLVGIKPGEQDDAIVGQPIGRDGLLVELEAEKIAYTPEELLWIGEQEYAWCEAEMKKVSREMGFGDNWRAALAVVREDYVEPGQQTQLVRDLALEAIEYVQKHDLVTVPPLAAEAWRMFMMAPERQKVNPFFLGGQSIIVSYPTDTMDHEAKLMSMRGNNIHYARATVFHELIPGHHLQLFINARHRLYRRLFGTPFSVEGWALYWEMVLWDDERFPKTPSNRVGMLFWRMHRCARILFSIKFHLGQLSPEECIDLLVDMVGHERATAEGEVRRSLNGDYSPLYQAGYMLGALQLYSLRQELVVTGRMAEKEFHDRILRNNQMPIEFVRALLIDLPLSADYRASWRFYGDPSR
ncbi:Xaa-Pro dipeptidyl-peptidase [Rasamsonia emersonii CBS 393.64]|uniref:Xaa-Pro dipeptidyl-peptidase n=1 Tax=Rasamsonia emersonii (strain ATCC 16479 / CBS 393.64 / IMI 116815) TaxID=1408163 RepID=A0A0F4Z4C1_RASE3|nr:Xaa-Pro dipeptidyl-peptidase [Rasamsonia emersonii CBS 393.64]KKA24946.1 Xaa-Pro dipeptidyl-peptidase [Rasamsonia emersonii CBS 393.64]